MNYPLKINNRIAQAVAILVFLTAYTTLIRVDLRWLIFPLTIDFILRYIHPKFSPTVGFFGFIDTKLLGNEPSYYYAPPKRFAVLVGVLITSIMSISLLFSASFVFYLFSSFLLVASFLQGFFNYCVGCKFYDLLVKAGVVGDYHNISVTI